MTFKLAFIETETSTSAQMKHEVKGEEESQTGTYYNIIYMKKVVLSLQQWNF